MKTFLTVTFLFILLNANAQGPTPLWAREGISSGAQPLWGEGWFVATDQLGNCYITGFYVSTISFGPFVLNASSGCQAFLVKYDSIGNVLWAKTSSGPGNAYGMYLATDLNNNVYWEGRYQNNNVTIDTVTLDSTGIDNIFLAKYDPTGNIQWVRTPDSLASVSYYSVTIDKFGNPIIAGSFYSPTVSFGSHTLVKTGLLNLFIVKYDPMGNVLWAKEDGGTANVACHSIVCDPDNNLFITGNFSSQIITLGNDTLTNRGNANIFVAKYDSSANEIWAKSIGGSNWDLGTVVSTNSSEYIYVAGDFTSPDLYFLSDTLINIGANNIFLSKFDSDGNLVWVECSRDSSFIELYGLITDNVGNPYISGGQAGYPNPYPIIFKNMSLQVPPPLIDPMFFMKFDTDGNPLCGEAFSTGGDDNNSLAYYPPNNLFVGGDFINDSLRFAYDTLYAYTAQEYAFLLKYNITCLANSVTDVMNENDIALYPNPVIDELHISIPIGNQFELKIFDVYGREMLDNVFVHDISLSTNQFSNGIYVCKIFDKTGNSISKKIIKQ